VDPYDGALKLCAITTHELITGKRFCAAGMYPLFIQCCRNLPGLFIAQAQSPSGWNGLDDQHALKFHSVGSARGLAPRFMSDRRRQSTAKNAANTLHAE
jgi:hypothetical protein